ncbi:MAG: hypothetical protein ABSG76_23835 [Xanthobacteraceae bacterium]
MRDLAILRRFDKFVIWGLRRRWHTHRFIHQHFYETLRKLELPAVWVDDAPGNNDMIGSNDLIIAADVAAAHLDPRRDACYVLHNMDARFSAAIPPEKRIGLYVYSRAAAQRHGAERWGAAVFFDPARRVLLQPWGTDLLAEEFRRPLPGAVRRKRLSFWIGSVWNNAENQGNLNEIAALSRALKQVGKTFVRVRFIPNAWNIGLVRRSCLAPAIGGAWQAANDYLPCRMFKNISYGHLGMSNIAGFDAILGDAAIAQHDIPAMLDTALTMTDAQFTERIAAQQERIRDYSYDRSLIRIAQAMAA